MSLLISVVMSISNVRYTDGYEIKEDFLFCLPLPGYTTGEEIFKVTDQYFSEHNLEWHNCISICTDGAAAMTGKIRGFITRASEKNPNIKNLHCFLHREALMTKSLPDVVCPTRSPQNCHRDR